MELQERRCYECKRIFKVLETSKQMFCSRLCQGMVDPKVAQKGFNLWLSQANQKKKSEYKKSALEKKELGSATSGGGITSLGFEKKKSNEEWIDLTKTQKKEKKSVLDQEEITKRTEKSEINSEKSGQEKTKNVSLPLNAPTTERNEMNSSQKSLQPVAEEIQQSDLARYSKSLRQEELGSMSLIDSSAKQLHDVMSSIVKKKRDNEYQTINTDDVMNICQLANGIKGLLEVKVNAMKTAKKFLKTAHQIEKESAT